MNCLLTGKRVLTRRSAMREASWWRRARFARMRHFYCNSCGGYHIGNEGRMARRLAR